jgi:hypothetical protein
MFPQVAAVNSLGLGKFSAPSDPLLVPRAWAPPPRAPVVRAEGPTALTVFFGSGANDAPRGNDDDGGGGGDDDDDDAVMMRESKDDEGKDGRGGPPAHARGYVLEIRTRPDLPDLPLGGGTGKGRTLGVRGGGQTFMSSSAPTPTAGAGAGGGGRERLWTPEFSVQGRYGADVREARVGSLVPNMVYEFRVAYVEDRHGGLGAFSDAGQGQTESDATAAARRGGGGAARAGAGGQSTSSSTARVAVQVGGGSRGGGARRG